MQTRDEAPDPPLMLDGVTLHKRSVELVATVREIAPLKPLSGAIVIVDAAFVRAVTEILVGLAVIKKS